MADKRLLVPARVRTLPQPPLGFSWIDRRFVRDRFIRRLTEPEILLYFFLVAVADAQGLSFWGDRSLAELLDVDHRSIPTARAGLAHADLIAYDFPLYQVLSLPEAQAAQEVEHA